MLGRGCSDECRPRYVSLLSSWVVSCCFTLFSAVVSVFVLWSSSSSVVVVVVVVVWVRLLCCFCVLFPVRKSYVGLGLARGSRATEAEALLRSFFYYLFFVFCSVCFRVAFCFVFSAHARTCREQEQERRERGPPPASRSALKNIPEVKVRAVPASQKKPSFVVENLKTFLPYFLLCSRY